MKTYVRHLIEHHIKYIETHGYDETVWITTNEHKKIDHRELFPMVSSIELAKISRDAHKRTRKFLDAKVNNMRYEISLKPTLSEMRLLVQEKPIL